MKFDKYQEEIVQYDLCSPMNEVIPVGLLEKVLGLAGEAGETADKFKKILRDKSGKISPEDRGEIVKELGDVLWYTATIARYLGVPFSEVAKQNLKKAESRKKRGKLGGSGDNR
ncbi:nucleoside triphosphate pyrophosphohydrolase family protein [Candidatus Saccharibacteria bacterium]|nr:nucleoside triphosphate pyrophosphohydrolase family protein [Candidatus Saccharibacteria bacterium]